MARLNYQEVIKSENETKEYTDSYLKGAKDNVPIILDVFFQLMYFTGSKNMGSNDGDFHTYCWHQYYHSGYSLRACIVLYERGYYLEANIILRRLLEILVRMKYLEKHNELAMDIWTNKPVYIKNSQNKKKKLSIRDMFIEVAPDAYDEFYGLILSSFVHGGIGSGLGKISYKSQTETEIMLGSKWSEDGATFVFNAFTVISLGYLKYFQVCFRDDWQNIDPVVHENYKKSIEWLSGSLDNHKSKYPHSHKWHDSIAPLIQ
jgi:hypothetical protein